MARAKKVEVEDVVIEDVAIEVTVEAKPVKISDDYGREDLNRLRDAVNELYARE